MTRVAIGLPVRNGGEHLDAALRALVGQTHSEISIVVCDNASTDETPAICDRYAQDPRATIHRWERDVGASENFNRAFRISDGAFFMWTAHDDRVEPTYMERCLERLEQNPHAAGCVTWVLLCEPNGDPLRIAREGDGLSSSDLGVRLRTYLRRDEHWWYHVYGLYRREALAGTGLFRPVYGPDVLLVWEVLLGSPLAVLDEPLLVYRTDPEKTVDRTMAGIGAGSRVSHARFAHAALWRRMWSLANERVDSSRALWTVRGELLRCLVHPRWRAMFALDFSREATMRWYGSRGLWQRLIAAPVAFSLAAIAVLLAPVRVLRELRQASRRLSSRTTFGGDA